jgi:uncharacterized protein (TIGR03437 family)
MPCRLFAASFAFAITATAQEARTSFATYFGGSEPDFGRAIAVGPNGDIWIAGVTHSTDFPVTAAWQSNCALGPRESCYDGFLARISADGRTVRFSTYLGGPTNDEITALAVDDQGYAYVTGRYRDGVLAARFDPEGRPVYVLSFGGPLLTMGRALARDESGNLYLAGETSSPSLPAVKAIHSTTGPVSCLAIGGGGVPIDGIVMKLDPSGRILFSTYLSGNGHDFPSAIAVDALGRIYVGGGTTSTNLPLPNALQRDYGGGPPQPVGTCAPGDAFVLQIDPATGRVLFGTLLGGPAADSIENVFVEGGGILTMTGTTDSGQGFPLTQSQSTAVSRTFGVRIDISAPALLDARLLGQPLGLASMSPDGRLTGGTDRLVRLSAADWTTRVVGSVGAPVQRSLETPDRNLLAIGSATVRDAFTTRSAFQPNNSGFHDVWLAKLTPAPEGRVIALNAASFRGPEISSGSIATLFTPEPGTEVRFQNLPARVIASAGNQINIVVPEGAEAGSAADIVVVRDGQQVASGSTLVARVAPALFTASANGRGAPAAEVIRVSHDGTRTAQSPFACDPTCRATPIDTSSENMESILTLYGTGIRNRTSPDSMKAVIAGEEVPVQFAGAQPTAPGLDQVNLRLPPGLAGVGEVELVLIVDGRLSNAVRLLIR